MHSVNIADLKNNLSRHLARVRQGAELTVFDRDTPVARIVPFTPRPAGNRTAAGRTAGQAESKQRVAELQRLGIIGRGDPEGLADLARSHAPVKLPKGTPSAVELLIQIRRDSTR
jgi:antitoxin (DNA-binding transcriptional repressor) of toxin-antitoxin stability system